MRSSSVLAWRAASLTSLVALVVLVAGTGACLLPGTDPCSCYDTGGHAGMSDTRRSCDGNTLVTQTVPECGPGCDSPSIVTTECGSETCVVYNSVDAMCARSCSSTADCDLSEYCGSGRANAVLVKICLPALARGSVCTSDPSAAPCARDLACRPDVGDAAPDGYATDGAGGADGAAVDSGGFENEGGPDARSDAGDPSVLGTCR